MHLRTLSFLIAATLVAPAWAQGGGHGHLKPQVGKASIYSKKFAGRKMANGAPMDPNDSNAASKTLPLGTRARVTNLANGKSAVVTIEDRGPHVPGRIVDLSPHSASEIGLTEKQGIAQVEVVPIELPGDSKLARD
jgi:rare lipoprotein A